MRTMVWYCDECRRLCYSSEDAARCADVDRMIAKTKMYTDQWQKLLDELSWSFRDEDHEALIGLLGEIKKRKDAEASGGKASA